MNPLLAPCQSQGDPLSQGGLHPDPPSAPLRTPVSQQPPYLLQNDILCSPMFVGIIDRARTNFPDHLSVSS